MNASRPISSFRLTRVANTILFMKKIERVHEIAVYERQYGTACIGKLCCSRFHALSTTMPESVSSLAGRSGARRAARDCGPRLAVFLWGEVRGNR
jgi:hypothetical protein